MNFGVVSHVNTEAASLPQLIAAAARADHRSFKRLYERTHVHLFGVALRLLGNRSLSEDVLQEAFVSIWKSAGSYQAASAAHDGHAMAWLSAVVRNKALDALREQARRKEDGLPDDVLDAAIDAPSAPASEMAGYLNAPTARSALDLFDQASRDLQIDACLSALDGSHRQSLALAYYQGLSHSEVAAQMGAPLGSVKAWIRRGLDKLKDCLAARGVLA
jgi:RNA polymerase sigma-70 factor, ECF subfamily